MDGYDVVAEGTTPPDSDGRGEIVRPWAEAGATWWIDADWSDMDPDRVRAAALAGSRPGRPRLVIDAGAYLDRIGYSGPTEPTAETLVALHRAHMLAVPFENLDIHLGRRNVLDPEHVFDKVVRRRRGGWCFELNGLFALLLETLGYTVTRYAAPLS